MNFKCISPYIPSPKSPKAGDSHFCNSEKREKAGDLEKVVEITLKGDNLVKLLTKITLFLLVKAFSKRLVDNYIMPKHAFQQAKSKQWGISVGRIQKAGENRKSD